MKLSEIESFQYKGSIELAWENRRHTVDVFYDPASKAVFQMIRSLHKWRKIDPGTTATSQYLPEEWSDLESSTLQSG